MHAQIIIAQAVEFSIKKCLFWKRMLQFCVELY